MSNSALFKKLAQKIKQVNEWTSIVLLIIMVLFVGTNVVTRYIFKFSFRWCEEIVIISFVYLVFMTIPLGMREGNHVAIEYFQTRFPVKFQKIVNIFITIVLMLLSVLIIVLGIGITLRIGKSVMPATHWPKGIVYITVPICFSLMVGYLFPILIGNIKDLKEK